jgi:ElaB/YqjD/DUF883 family membrane-anchored ribosome-binding protein
MNRSDVADYETVKEDIAALKHQVGELLAHVKAAATGSAEGLYTDLRREAEAPLNSLAERVQKKPVESVLVAFAIGYVFGRLMRS